MADPDVILLDNPQYSVSHTFSTDDITLTFDGDTVGSLDDPLLGLDTTGTNGTKTTKDGSTTLYPINSEFGFLVTDFDGAVQKDFLENPEYLEGWAGNLTGEGGEQAGVVISDAPTDTFKTPALLGTWLAGLGGNTVKASTEHYVVMQNVLSDQKYPGDPNAEYMLDDNLKVVGGDYDGYAIYDLLNGVEVDGIGFVDVGDVNGDGVEDIKDILSPNESSIRVDIAASTDYSVTLKDDGKLLYRWGNTVKRPNDVRLEVEMELPEEWSAPDTDTGLTPLYRITAAELITNHTITNNPNDQIRPEDYENEAAIGQLPTYQIISDYNEDGQGPREVWVSTDDYYAGDGTLYEAGTILRDDLLAQQSINDNTVLDDIGGLSSDLVNGFTNAWYTTMDRAPFTADYDTPDNEYAPGAEYDTGPRWRLQTDKYGQDLPSVVIPTDPSSPPPPTQSQVKYDVGEDTTTVINLLDWGNPVSPLSISAGWQNNAGTVSGNGVNMTENFDVAFYIKGDIKPATLYNTELRMNYEEIEIFDKNSTITGAAGDDYLVGQGRNSFEGGVGSDLFVLGYGVGSNWADVGANTISDFEVGVDVIGLFGFGIDEFNFGEAVHQEVVGSDLVLSLRDVEFATLTGVGATTDELEMESSFLLLNPGVSINETFIGGTNSDDYLVGDEGANRIWALDGNDTVLSLGGNDTLLGNAGDDSLIGGADDDNLFGGTGQDTLEGNDGDDNLLGEGGFDRLLGGAGDDTLDGGNQADNLFGGTGNDELLGGNGLDRLFGELGNDVMSGGAGNDVLVGGAGFDRIVGGEDNDRLSGNFNADTFVFADGHGQDTVTDFDALNIYEKIDFAGVSSLTDFASVQSAATQVGSDVLIDTGGGNSVLLLNVNETDLDGSDFLFA